MTAHDLVHLNKLFCMEKETTLAPINDKMTIQSLYEQLIKSWNENNSENFSALFAEDGSIVGFDGSQANGKTEIQKHLSGIFADHRTASYVTVIREIRLVTPEVGILRSVVGMVPPGQKQINPATNAVQSMVAVKKNERFKIALFQNTPAAFHGRPEDAKRLTKELQDQLEKESE
jgi:uncharacterized protein (TIGR02246 family)